MLLLLMPQTDDDDDDDDHALALAAKASAPSYCIPPLISLNFKSVLMQVLRAAVFVLLY